MVWAIASDVMDEMPHAFVKILPLSIGNPTSQIIGTMAMMNVMMGYKMVQRLKTLHAVNSVACKISDEIRQHYHW